MMGYPMPVQWIPLKLMALLLCQGNYFVTCIRYVISVASMVASVGEINRDLAMTVHPVHAWT